MAIGAIVGAVGLNALLGAASALAGQQVYVYTVVHPSYGEIGTRTDVVDRAPDGMRIESHLRIVVELIGISFYRQESDITEVMHGDRLVFLRSLTEKDGQHIEVHGEARGGQFMVEATGGSSVGPLSIAPSDPWVLKDTGEGTLVYPSTGTIRKARVSGGEYETISLNGAAVSARHFVVIGYNREDVWLDAQGIPVKFRSIEDGTPIDFVLQKAPPAADATLATAREPAVLARSGNNGK